MRNVDTIDSELRLIVAVRRTVRRMGGPAPSSETVDRLLDERETTTDSGRTGDTPQPCEG